MKERNGGKTVIHLEDWVSLFYELILNVYELGITLIGNLDYHMSSF